MEPTSSTGTISDGVAVYDGRRLLGFVIERRDGAEALRPNGVSLGLFNDQVAAARALFAAARQGSTCV